MRAEIDETPHAGSPAQTAVPQAQLAAQATKPADVQSIPFEAQEELDMADAIFSKEKFGEILGKRVSPFSKQVKTDIEDHFPVDMVTFAGTNKLQFWIDVSYFVLRLATLSLFFTWLFVTASAIVALWRIDGLRDHFPWLDASANQIAALRDALMSYPVISQPFPLLLSIVVAALLMLFAMRWALRSLFFWAISLNVGWWASHVILDHANIVNRITDCCAKIISRPAEGSGVWPRFAKNWVKVALFNAKRVEYLDRHSTTALWKMNRDAFELEWFFRGVKFTTFAVFFCLLFNLDALVTVGETFPVAYKIILLVLMSVASIFFWDRFTRRNNDIWAENLIDQFNRRKPQKAHYFDQIGDAVSAVVANLVATDQN